MRPLALLLAALLLLPAAAAIVPDTMPESLNSLRHPPPLTTGVPLAVAQDGPPAPPAAKAPDAVVVAFQDEYWHNAEGPRTHTIAVPVSPSGLPWSRIVLVYREYPSHDPAQQDPWDRLCSAAIAGVEVLRCTTPRTDFTLRKDVTEYASLLPMGGLADITANTGSYDQPQYYVGGQWVDVGLEFYDLEPTAATVLPPASHVVPAFYHRTMCADGTPQTATVTFPAQPPTVALAEITLSGHGYEEFFYGYDGHYRSFHLFVDGTEVAQVVPRYYSYANYGYYGQDYGENEALWWDDQAQLQEQLGVHSGVGLIPGYRAAVLPGDLGLLAGTHTVSLVGDDGNCYWPASVSFLLR